MSPNGTESFFGWRDMRNMGHSAWVCHKCPTTLMYRRVSNCPSSLL